MSQSGSRGSGSGSPSDPGIPESIDHYRIQRRLGRGGQGDVFLAHDPNLDLDVAIKVLLADYRTEEVLDRFAVEARTAVRLTAPNIVRVYNFNPRYPYLVMEYCGEGDLNRVIKSREPMTLAQSLGLIRQICEALVVAHENDSPILHRDLKPGNVLFNRGIPKVADFGLAKMLTGASSGLTATRGMMGTVGYSSPEQLRDASSVDHRSDLWSVGVMLYELLTFTRPFDKPGDDYVNVAIKVRMEPPAEPAFPLPAPIPELLERALQKEPESRFQSAREMITALDQVLAAVADPDSLQLPPPEILDEMDRMASEAARLMDSGSMDAAETLVQKMRSISPDDSLPRYWGKQIRATREAESFSGSSRTADSADQREAAEVEGRLQSIQRMIESREYRDARRQVGELMVRDPDNSVIHRYLERINAEETALSAALNDAHANAQSARGSGRPDEVLRIWTELHDRFPDHPDIEAELAVARKEQELQARKAERERRLTQVRGHVEQRLEAGDREGALVLWEALLEQEPGDDEVRRQVDGLRQELQEERRGRSREEARTTAGRLTDAGDRVGALATWRRHLAAFADDAEALAEIERLERAAREDRQRLQAARRERLAARLERRVSERRYASVPRVADELTSAVDRVRAAAGSGAGELDAGPDALVEAAHQAETRLAEALSAARGALAARLDEGRELARDPESGSVGIPSPAEAALHEAVAAATVALCEVAPADRPGDPLALISDAEKSLEAALDGVGDERRAGIEAARAVATEAVESARVALDRLGTAQDEAGRTAVDDLRQALPGLAEQTDSRSAPRLNEVAREASALRERARMLGATANWNAIGKLVRQRDRLLESLEGDDGARSALVDEASERLAAIAPDAPPPSDLGALSERIEQALSAWQRSSEEQARSAAATWSAAVATWDQAVAGAKEGERVRRGLELRRQGEEALEARAWAAVRAIAAALTALAAGARVESFWSAHGPAILDLDRQSDEAAGSIQGRVRRALASGEASALDELPAVVEQAPRSGVREAEPAVASDLPRPSARMRRLNEKLQPEAVERFDQAMKQLERSERGRGERTSSAREVQRAFDRWVEPDPWWPALVPVAAGLIVLLVAGWFARPAAGPTAFDVTLLSPAGDRRVERLLRDGSPVDGTSETGSTIGESGVRWQLAPGGYEVGLEGGASVRFEVPRDRTVLVPGVAADLDGLLLRELGLDDPAGAP